MLRNLFFLLLLISFNQNSFGQAWTQPKGQGYYKLDFQMIKSRQFFANDREIIDINGAGTQLSSYTTSFYGEHGITDRLSVMAYVPLMVRNTVNEGVGSITGEVLQPGLENTSIGDIDLSLRYNFLKNGPWVLSGNLLFGLPTGDSDNEDLLFTGDGEFNQLINLAVGYGGNRWYASGHLGFNNRTNNFSDEWHFNIEGGYWAIPSTLLLQARVISRQSLDNGDPLGSANGLFANNVEFISPQLGLAYQFSEKWGVAFNAAGAVAGRNVLAAPSFSGGIYTSF